jgi:hypothetical protein
MGVGSIYFSQALSNITAQAFDIYADKIRFQKSNKSNHRRHDEPSSCEQPFDSNNKVSL